MHPRLPLLRDDCVDDRQLLLIFVLRPCSTGVALALGPRIGVHAGGSLAGNDSIDASSTASLSSGSSALFLGPRTALAAHAWETASVGEPRRD